MEILFSDTQFKAIIGLHFLLLMVSMFLTIRADIGLLTKMLYFLVSLFIPFIGSIFSMLVLIKRRDVLRQRG